MSSMSHMCVVCDLKFTTRYDFESHLSSEHGVASAPPNKPPAPTSKATRQTKEQRVLTQWASARPEWRDGLHSGERKMLMELIGNDEDVLALLGGTFVQDTDRTTLKRHKGVVVATNKRVLFLDKGLFGNSEVMEIAHRTIESITYSTGMFRGGIQIVGRGSSSYRIEDIAPKHANAAFAECVRNQIDLAHAPAVPPAAPLKENVSTSNVSELERVVTLFKDGHITEDEFATMKQKIIGG